MIAFVGYIVPIFIYAVLFFKSKKPYALAFLIFFTINSGVSEIEENFNEFEFGIFLVIEFVLLILGCTLVYKDYMKMIDK